MFALQQMLSMIGVLSILPVQHHTTSGNARAKASLSFDTKPAVQDWSGMHSGPCPAQWCARSPKQRAKLRARTGRK